MVRVCTFKVNSRSGEEIQNNNGQIVHDERGWKVGGVAVEG